MKEQTTALAASFLLVLVLVGLLVFLIFRFQTQEEQETGEAQSSSEEVLLSLSVDDINTIQIQNPSDEFTLVNQGDGFVIEGLEELDVSSLNVSNLTACFSNLTAQRKLLSLSEETEAETIGDSQESLVQYGLDTPSYTVKIVTAEGTEEVLYLGDEAPNGSSVYALYADGVYLLNDDILDSVSRHRYSFLNNEITEAEPEYTQAVITLSGSVRPSAITLEIQTVEDEESAEAEETEEVVVSSTEKE